MARSLAIQPEEDPSTSPLLTGFLVLAALVMLGSAVLSADGPVDTTAPVTTAAGVR